MQLLCMVLHDSSAFVVSPAAVVGAPRAGPSRLPLEQPRLATCSTTQKQPAEVGNLASASPGRKAPVHLCEPSFCRLEMFPLDPTVSLSCCLNSLWEYVCF